MLGDDHNVAASRSLPSGDWKGVDSRSALGSRPTTLVVSGAVNAAWQWFRDMNYAIYASAWFLHLTIFMIVGNAVVLAIYWYLTALLILSR
jgi:hypothetical protein